MVGHIARACNVRIPRRKVESQTRDESAALQWPHCVSGTVELILMPVCPSQPVVPSYACLRNVETRTTYVMPRW